jgi:hypothetical protein
MKEQRLEILQKVANGELTLEQADEQLLGLFVVEESLHPDLISVYEFIESLKRLKRLGLLEIWLYENRKQVAELKTLLGISS